MNKGLKNKGLVNIDVSFELKSTTLNIPVKTAVVCLEQQYRDLLGSMAVSGGFVYDLKTDRRWTDTAKKEMKQNMFLRP